MKIKCPNCNKESHIWKLRHDDAGFYVDCLECESTIAIDDKIITEKMFITDHEKMADFKILAEDDFLASYSYLTEDEYDATLLYLDWLNADDSEP